MAGPIFCYDQRQQESPYMDLVCANLQQNRVGELELFREGNSVFNIFYKYSALNKFCMHSDWALGYMISLYSGGSLTSLTAKSVQAGTKKPRPVGFYSRNSTKITVNLNTIIPQIWPSWWCRSPLIRRRIYGLARSYARNLFRRGRTGGWLKRLI